MEVVFLPPPQEVDSGYSSTSDSGDISFEIPDSCLKGLADFDAGRVVDLKTALDNPPMD